MIFKNRLDETITTSKLAILLIPAMTLSAGITSLMAAKSYEIIRLANANGKAIEEEKKLHD